MTPAQETEYLAAIERENILIKRANVEIESLRAAGHKANGKRIAQGVEIEIIRQGWQGLERSFLIVTETV